MHLIAFLLIIVQYEVESQIIGSRIEKHERAHLQKLAVKKDLHMKTIQRNEEIEMMEPSCTSKRKTVSSFLPSSLTRREEHKRLKRQVRNNSPRDASPYGTAAYFSGNSESLKYKGTASLPNHQFSAGVWIQPEGGQNTPVHFVGKK